MLPIAEYVSKFYSGKVVEVGIGYNWKVALRLKDLGFEVVATDLKPIDVPVEFYVDDVTDPKVEIYEGASLIYTIRPPPEIVPYILRIAEVVKSDVIVRPFGNEFYDGRLINYKGERFYLWRCRDW